MSDLLKNLEEIDKLLENLECAINYNRDTMGEIYFDEINVEIRDGSMLPSFRLSNNKEGKNLLSLIEIAYALGRNSKIDEINHMKNKVMQKDIINSPAYGGF
ncbi:MAG: hypothetical protein WC783_02975 [Candidatus Paceibacterota bacterium]|jgi:hypothetical protein